MEEKNIARKIVKLMSISFFFFHFSSKVNKLKHSFRFYLFILIDRANTFTGLPSQSYKLAAMRELHIGIPGNGDGWDTSTYPIEFIRRFYLFLKSNHVRPSVFQTFGIITSAFLCRTIREMQVDWNSWDGKSTKEGRETNFQTSVEFLRRSNDALFWCFIRSLSTILRWKYSFEGTTIHTW